MRDSEAWSVKLGRRLRREMTDAEVILWLRLRRNVISGLRFRRQHPIGPYVADFACVSARLVVEVDGGTHSTDAERLHDRHRDAYMHTKGWRIFRITNEDIYKNLDSVLDGIVRFAPPPSLRDTSPADAGEENQNISSSTCGGGGERSEPEGQSVLIEGQHRKMEAFVQSLPHTTVAFETRTFDPIFNNNTPDDLSRAESFMANKPAVP